MERRRFLRDCAVVGATSVACSTGLLTSSIAFATESDPFQATSVDAVLAALGVGSPKVSDQIKITAPKVAENGASVPVAITSMIKGTTEIITIVAENPKPLAARNRFGKGAIPWVQFSDKDGRNHGCDRPGEVGRRVLHGENEGQSYRGRMRGVMQWMSQP